MANYVFIKSCMFWGRCPFFFCCKLFIMFRQFFFVILYDAILQDQQIHYANFSFSYSFFFAKTSVFCCSVIFPNPIMNMQFSITKYDTPNFNQQNSCINNSMLHFFHINYNFFFFFLNDVVIQLILEFKNSFEKNCLVFPKIF